MFKKLFITVLALILTLVTAMSMVSAAEAPADNEWQLTVAKTWNVKDNSFFNNSEEFQFELEYLGAEAIGTLSVPTSSPNIDAGDFNQGSKKQLTVTGDWKNAASGSLSSTLSNTFSNISFSQPGVYKFKLSEKAGSNPQISYNEAPKYYSVQVVYKLQNEAPMPSGDVIVNGWWESDTLDGLKTEFGNQTKGNQTVAEFDVTNEAAAAGSLIIENRVSGNMSDVTKHFGFTITLTGAGSANYPITYTVNSCGEHGTPISVTGGSANIKLKHGESVEIKNIPSTATYQVTETDSQGYTTTIDNAGSQVTGLSASGTMADSGKRVVYTNDATETAPTGIILDMLPFILLFAGAGVLVIFFRKKTRNRV